MSILDGDIRGIFGEIFGSIYLDGALHKANRTDAVDGEITVTDAAPIPVKYQADETKRYARGDGHRPAHEAVLLVLQEGLLTAPTRDDQITAGIRYAIIDIETDPANSHWVLFVSKA